MPNTELIFTPGNGRLYTHTTVGLRDLCKKVFLANEQKPGRIATLPELLQGRAERIGSLCFPKDAVSEEPLRADPLWSVPISTRSGIFIGYHKQTRPVVVVTHEDHPLEENYDDANNTLTKNGLNDLVDGKYGPVDTFEIADLQRQISLHQPGRISYHEASALPFLRALLGQTADSYLEACKMFHTRSILHHSVDLSAKDEPCPSWKSSLPVFCLNVTVLDFSRLFVHGPNLDVAKRGRGFHVRLHPVAYSPQNTRRFKNIPVFTSKIEIVSPHKPASTVLYIEGPGSLNGTRAHITL